MADDFLFDSGRGYCVHFASSMVMLLRLNGIPARLSSGYRYAFPFDRQDVYEVSGGSAHMWPQAYIEGYGWVGFEPTSVLSTAEDRTWHRRRVSASAAQGTVNNAVKNTPIPIPVEAYNNEVK
ncbi:MAG: transglutaminase domain-containing protein, partial [Selenomonas sp.]|nr:transglutaminase domain-containing protein [Selenomonas sp.]